MFDGCSGMGDTLEFMLMMPEDFTCTHSVTDMARILTVLYLLDEITPETWERYGVLFDFAKMNHKHCHVWKESKKNIYKEPKLKDLVLCCMQILLEDSKIQRKAFKAEKEVIDYLNGLEFDFRNENWLQPL